ncbi:MAG: TetR/AcrR family transcriptional regulator [Novosphingobium sp.]
MTDEPTPNLAVAQTPAAPPRRRRRTRSLSQDLRNQATRMKLIEAAGRVIGKHGYAGCTIARVTTRARIAHGTFYLHFRSQQDLFDAVLPVLGAQMLAFVADCVRDSADVVDLERRGFAATFSYLFDHPHMARVTEEAAYFAPEAYRRHLDEMATGYARSLLRSRADRQLEDFSPAELPMLAQLLIGARFQMLWQFRREHEVGSAPPADIVEIYIRFISRGILGGSGASA